MKASPASSLPRGKRGFNFAYFSCLWWLVFLCFFLFLLFEFLLPSRPINVFNLLFTYLSWVPRHLLPKALLALSLLKMKRGLISFLASTSLKGEGELDLFYGLNIARRRGGLICSSGSSTSLEGEGGLYLNCTVCPRSRRDLLNARSYRPQRV